MIHPGRPHLESHMPGSYPAREIEALLWGKTPTVAGKVEGGGWMVEGAADGAVDGAVEGLGNWAFVSTFAV